MVLGDILIVCAQVSGVAGAVTSLHCIVIMSYIQVVVAFQSVYEEKVLVKYDIPPLLAVGWEGVFGFSVLSLLLIPMGYWKVKMRF